MNILLLVLAGCALGNAVPHLAAGLRGEPFPTPFAIPRGRGASSPLVNGLWGAFNVGVALFAGRLGLGLPFDWAPWAVLAGFTISAALLSWRFGAVRRSGSF